MTISQVMQKECKKIYPGYKGKQFRMWLACCIGGQALADVIVLTPIRDKVMDHAENKGRQLLHRRINTALNITKDQNNAD